MTMRRAERKNPALEEIVYRMKSIDPLRSEEECIVCGCKNRLLTDGVCTDCVLDTVDYDTVYKWLKTYDTPEQHEEVTHIEGLMLSRWMCLPAYEMPSGSTRAIKEMLLMEYLRQKAEDEMVGTGFLREIKQYIKSDGIDDYARFIVDEARKEVG